mmetsp:Transcript_130958/g.326742  ORF Transcript_130958/g.326742 Transcript_130958/m.326742 type:complete len:206 (-) Transcript_130958:927-1544(-)
MEVAAIPALVGVASGQPPEGLVGREVRAVVVPTLQPKENPRSPGVEATLVPEASFWLKEHPRRPLALQQLPPQCPDSHRPRPVTTMPLEVEVEVKATAAQETRSMVNLGVQDAEAPMQLHPVRAQDLRLAADQRSHSLFQSTFPPILDTVQEAALEADPATDLDELRQHRAQHELDGRMMEHACHQQYQALVRMVWRVLAEEVHC